MPPLTNPPTIRVAARSVAQLAHLRTNDLRAAAQLATSATRSVARIAEGVNQAVWSTLGAPSGKTAMHTRGITGLVFQSVQGITGMVGKGVDAALSKLLAHTEIADNHHGTPQADSPKREAVLAALNGVLGDHLASSGNALATPMTLRYQGEALRWQVMPAKSQVSGKVLLLIHGLCMNDLQWRTTSAAGNLVDHGATLAAAMHATPVYLRYNTGLHTSTNGQDLCQQLEQLQQHWPKRITELTIIVHSMGGLVARSAVHTAQATNAAWLKKLKSLVFLGTPHHGAPLEKAGNWVDVILGSTPYSRPFAKLGQLRSAGITDLRYGNTLDTHWQGQARFDRAPDQRVLLPLPSKVACYTVAGTTAAKRSVLAERLVGDGLVTLRSALGQHDDAARSLQFDPVRTLIAYRTNHMQLLSSAAVGAQLVRWLAP